MICHHHHVPQKPGPPSGADDEWDARLWGTLVLLYGVLLLDGLNAQHPGDRRGRRPEQDLASGLVSTSFQVGGAVVLAVVSAVVTSQTGSATDPASLLDGFRPAIAVPALVAALGLTVAVAGTGRRPSRPAPVMATE